MKLTHSHFNSLLLLTFIVLNSSQTYAQEKKVKFDSNSYEQNIQNLIKLKLESELPTIIADGINGDVFNSNQTKKTVFYYFWYADCGDACSSQLSMLNQLQNQYKDSVDFISIVYDNKARLLEFLGKHTFNFKHYMMNQNQIEIMKITYGYPTTMITVNGIIKYWYPGGSMNFEEINKLKNKYQEIISAGK